MRGHFEARMTALSALLAASSCGPPPASIDPEGPPHVVVVLIDTLRADHTSLHGYERRTTKHLERIAEDGAWMRRHFVNAPWTKPSVASILTGLHPTAHGSRVGQFEETQGGGTTVDILDEAHDTFVELLQRAGYRTAAHVTNIHLQPKWGYAQGYDDYEFVGRTSDDKAVDSDAAAMRFVVDTLDEATTPTFVWAHLMSVHEYVAPRRHRVYDVPKKTPLDPDAPGVGRVSSHGSIEMAEAHYDQSIRYCDALVGDLYDRLRRRHPHTILIVTSDHGEEFYDHGGFEHCRTLYNELLRVPLVIVGPGVPAGVQVEGITDSLDLFPTILSLVGVDVDGLERPGQPLIDPDGGVSAGKTETFAEQHHRGPSIRFALNAAGTKLIETYEKLDGVSDEERVGPLDADEWYAEAWTPETPAMSFAPDDAQRARLRERLDLYRTATRSWFARAVDERSYGDVTADDMGQLRALGYGGGR